jgi:hypothetical protein
VSSFRKHLANSLAWLCVAGGTSVAAQVTKDTESPVRIIDAFDRVDLWSTHPTDSARLTIRAEAGAMRIDFDFAGPRGRAVVRRAITLSLPANYEFAIRMRGVAPTNHIELRLLGDEPASAWSAQRRNVAVSAGWDTVRVRKRQFTSAQPAARMDSVSAIELAIVAGEGGAGTIWIDQLSLVERAPDQAYALKPDVRAASAEPGEGAPRVIDQDTLSAWRSAVDFDQWLEFDFHEPRELGGLVIDWDSVDHAVDYEVRFSADGHIWTSAYTVSGSNGGRDWIRLPESETRYLQLALQRSARGRGFAVRNVAVQPVGWAEKDNDLFTAIARAAPAGSYPRYFGGQASYWTAIGADGDAAEALLAEDGAIEIARGGPLLEPLLLLDGKLRTWADVQTQTRLAEGELPIPEVRWLYQDSLVLSITAFVAGARNNATLYVRYRIENHSAAPLDPLLFIAVRPFQVTPPGTGAAGGTTRIDEIGWDGRAVTVNGAQRIVPLVAPTSFGTVTFDQGDIIEYVRTGQLPARPRSVDAAGLASAALAFGFVIEPGSVREANLAVPMQSGTAVPAPGGRAPEAADMFVREMAATAAAWRSLLDGVQFNVPVQAERVLHTLRSSIAWIRIQRDPPALQTGSRGAVQTRLRDAALTAEAMLRLGQSEAVREFLEWSALLPPAGGAAPCCADAQDNSAFTAQDSHGQLLFLLAEYHRHTGDGELLQRLWPAVQRVVAHIDRLRQTRRTGEYRSEPKRAYFGLLPRASGSDTASAALHVYEDQFFALRGLNDAVYIAQVTGQSAAATEFATLRDEFRRDLLASIRTVMAAHNITYMPGSVELAEFDPAAVAAALAPGGEDYLPADALTRTFERYWQNFVARRDGRLVWDGYSARELRIVSAFVRLGWKARISEALAFFFRDQRPAGWNQWTDSVPRAARAPLLYVDMPDGRIAADYIAAVLDMFAYERDADEALVLGAGIPEDWVSEGGGIAVRGLSTHYGKLDFSMRATDSRVTVRIGSGLRMPAGGIVLRSPLGLPITRASADGRPVPVSDGREVRLDHIPAELVLYY